MPGTGHSHRFKSSISSRNARPRFNVLAPWSARKTGVAGDVAVSQGGDTLSIQTGIGTLAGGPAPTIRRNWFLRLQTTWEMAEEVLSSAHVADFYGQLVTTLTFTFASPYATIPLV